ncbi:hypothetical protein GCM10010521_41440 [Streptomyces rameus]|uniref:Uncharacterized protein n=1 Tax=Streptomyces rameus TaxID=68261 RepID=A0ABP6NKQ4_9ACTN
MNCTGARARDRGRLRTAGRAEERMGLLDDKVVLVNGGSRGVGAATARAAVREGAAVAVTGRRTEPGEALVAELSAAGGRALFVRADLADAGQAKASAAEVADAYGRIDCLVNSAGLTSRGTLPDTTPELFDAHVAVSLRGPSFAMQAAVADMRARGAPGAIVNIITSSAHGGQPFLAPYVAAKAGLAGLTRNAAHAHRWDRDPDQRSEHRLDGDGGRGRRPARLPRRRRRLAGAGRAPGCRWAGWAGRRRSRTSSSCCCRTGPAWPPAR